MNYQNMTNTEEIKLESKSPFAITEADLKDKKISSLPTANQGKRYEFQTLGKSLAEQQAEMIFGNKQFSNNINTHIHENYSSNEVEIQTIRDTIELESRSFDQDYLLSLETWKDEILSGKRDEYEEGCYILIRKIEGIKEKSTQELKKEVQDTQTDKQEAEESKVIATEEQTQAPKKKKKKVSTQQKIKDQSGSYNQNKLKGMDDSKLLKGYGYHIMPNGIADIMTNDEISPESKCFFVFLLTKII